MCPIRRVRIYRKKISCEWMNVQLPHCSLSCESRLRSGPPLIVSHFFAAFALLCCKTIDENKSKPAVMWKELKKLLRNKNETPQKIIQFGDKKVESCLQIAESFNSNFVKSIEDNVKDVKNQCHGRY
jgi:hypothetical protein